MQGLDGIHHISAITADATRNVLFYTGVMGLRLVKKTVNQDDPSVCHLFYADEEGSPGADLTFFEYPGLVRGRADGSPPLGSGRPLVGATSGDLSQVDRGEVEAVDDRCGPPPLIMRSLREQVEANLTPLPNPREATGTRA